MLHHNELHIVVWQPAMCGVAASFFSAVPAHSVSLSYMHVNTLTHTCSHTHTHTHTHLTAGAELANVVNEASLLAARREAEEITLLDLAEGVQRTRFGVNGRTPGGPAPLQKLGEWVLGGLGSNQDRFVKVSAV